MGFKCGIVGLPNVGKSTLFNALTRTAQAQAENYPFCTIEPNIGEVAVPDPRLDAIAGIVTPKEIVPTRLTFMDIAGLVRGASNGEGLGNQFLSHIRGVDAVAYVLRCFEDTEITHVEGRIDPLADAEIVETELMLADLESLENRRTGVEKKAKGGDKEAKTNLRLIDAALEMLRAGKPARLAQISEDETQAYRALDLLTAKPVLYVCNVDEAAAASGNAYSKSVEDHAARHGAGTVTICAALEADLAALSRDEASDYLSELGLVEPGLNRLIRAGYDLLGLITFFTAGPKEARAWTIPRGTRAPGAAGTIHTDFEKGFIRAETISYDEFVTLGGETAAKEAGKMRLEGKDYMVADGDVMHFRFAN